MHVGKLCSFDEHKVEPCRHNLTHACVNVQGTCTLISTTMQFLKAILRTCMNDGVIGRDLCVFVCVRLHLHGAVRLLSFDTLHYTVMYEASKSDLMHIFHPSVGKNVSKPAVTAPGPSSHRVLQASNAPSAFHRPLKPKGTPVAATLETKPRGKIKSPAKTTAIAEEHANDGGEEKAEEVGRDNARDKKMEDSINGHRSGIENAEENKSEVSTDFVCQNQVGLGTGRAAFPGGISTEQSRSFVVHIDIPDGTSGSAHMDELSARFEAARTQCMCTHAHVTLKYESTRDGPGQLPDSTFMAPLSQCHMLICALCTYMKCSSVLVSAYFFVF